MAASRAHEDLEPFFEQKDAAKADLLTDPVNGPAYVLIFALPLLFGLASMTGSYIAGQQQNFMVLDRNGATFALVGIYVDGVVFSAFQDVAADQHVLTDPPEIIWISNADLSGMSLVTATLPNGIAPSSLANKD